MIQQQQLILSLLSGVKGFGRIFAGLFSCWMLSFVPLMGQSQWVHRHFDIAEGLPDRTVNFVANDSFGYSWLATETGLVRFDGKLFSRPPFLNELHEDGENITRNLVLDAHERLVIWTGGADFIQYFNTRTYKVAKPTYKQLGGPAGVHRHFVLKADQNPLELRQTADSMYVYRLGKSGEWENVQQYSSKQATISSFDRLLGVKPDGSYLFYQHASQTVVVVLDNEIKQRIPTGAENPESGPRLLYLDKLGRTWLGTDGDPKLWVCLPGRANFELADAALQMPKQAFNKVFEDRQGKLIFGQVLPTVTNCLVKYEPDGTVTDLANILKLETKIVSISGENFNEAFDLATHEGLYRIRRPANRSKKFLRYLNDPELPDNGFGYVMRGFAYQPDTECIYGNTEGALWLRFCPPDFQLDTFYPRQERKQGESRIGAGHNLIADDQYVYGLYARAEEKGTKGFLTRYDGENDEWCNFEIPHPGAFGRFVIKLPDGELLVFTYRRSDRSSVIYRFNPLTSSFTCIGELNELLSRRSRGSVQNVIYDPGRRLIWIAMGNGLFSFPYCSPQDNCYFETITFTRYQRINFHVQTLVLNGKNDLWLGTYGEGVQLFDPDSGQLSTFAYVAKSPQDREDFINLPSNLIAELLPLNDNYLAITTYNGLVIAELDSKQAILYQRKDGLPDNEFNRLSALLTPAGKMILGGVNGFTLTSLESVLPQPTGPSPALSNYYLIDEAERQRSVFYPPPGESLEKIVVPPGQLYLGLNFFTDLDSVAGYSTWLENYEPNYGPLKNEAHVDFLRLPGGSYTLHVKVLTDTGEESAVALSIPIEVKKPWYFRTWFLLLVQALIFGSIYFFYRQRLERVKRQEAEKRKIDRRLADLELRILRQQLNPHFIFNALGAIQHFIQTMRGRDAMQYLADFARLMRMFLEASKQPYIFLADELQIIQLYIRLEQLRFQQRFDVIYQIDPKLDLDMEDIPSLLLQPYVENAINHGLFHLRRQGTLTIGMQLDAKQRIVCTVMDDGVGRKVAAALQKKTYRKHKSRATQIVAERLEIFQRSGTTDLTIKAEDLYPEREETGTKVTIIVDNRE